MDINKRAEKMVQDMLVGLGDKSYYEYFMSHLNAERKAGREETHCKVNCGCFAEMRARQLADAEGYRRGLEDGAKIAESYLMIGSKMNPQFPQIAKNTAEQIRALKEKK